MNKFIITSYSSLVSSNYSQKMAYTWKIKFVFSILIDQKLWNIFQVVPKKKKQDSNGNEVDGGIDRVTRV